MKSEGHACTPYKPEGTERLDPKFVDKGRPRRRGTGMGRMGRIDLREYGGAG